MGWARSRRRDNPEMGRDPSSGGAAAGAAAARGQHSPGPGHPRAPRSRRRARARPAPPHPFGGSSGDTSVTSPCWAGRGSPDGA